MKIILLVSALFMVGCLEGSKHYNNDCGPMPDAPDWEYTLISGAPEQAQIPSQMWFADLEWRKEIIAWGACVTDDRK